MAQQPTDLTLYAQGQTQALIVTLATLISTLPNYAQVTETTREMARPYTDDPAMSTPEAASWVQGFNETLAMLLAVDGSRRL